MRILSISVGGFKNLRLTRVELDQICALISPNNYGKSNLLEAIDFGVDFIHQSRKGRKNMMGWIKGIPLCSALEEEEYRFEVEFDDESLGEYRYVRYGYSFRWRRDDNQGEMITDEWIDTRENTSVRYTSYLKRREGKYRRSKETTAFRKIDLDGLQLAVDVLALLDEIEIADVVDKIQHISFRICSSLDLGQQYQPYPLEYVDSEDDSLRFDDEDVPKALSRLKKQAPDLYALFEDAVYTLFPEFTSISLREYALTDQQAPNRMTVVIGDKEISAGEIGREIPFRLRERVYRLFIKCSYMNQAVSAASMSMGTKRVIWLLANAFISGIVNTGIIGIEEIETSIHPRMIRQLLETLTEALAGTPMIVSSHSPYLLQYLKPERIYIGVPNKEGVAEFRRIRKSKIKTIVSNARDLELSVGEYLFEMLSGDSDAYAALESFLEG